MATILQARHLAGAPSSHPSWGRIRCTAAQSFEPRGARPDPVSNVSCSYIRHRSWQRRGSSSSSATRAQSTSSSEPTETYQGIYGPWTVEERDRREVLGYRLGLSAVAAAILLDATIARLPQTSGLRPLENAIALAGAAGFGASLVLIHIYVKPLKRFLQLLYSTGLAGSLFLMATQSQPIPEHVASHPGAVWLVGPLFAALTGVAFKEGMCYGKPECAALFFVTPTLLLGHLSGLMPGPLKDTLLAVFVLLTSVFALRKYTQEIKDDIGDKSVFEFMDLSEEDKEKRTWEVRQQRSSASLEDVEMP